MTGWMESKVFLFKNFLILIFELKIAKLVEFLEKQIVQKAFQIICLGKWQFFPEKKSVYIEQGFYLYFFYFVI
jgi:hypothetical protein